MEWNQKTLPTIQSKCDIRQIMNIRKRPHSALLFVYFGLLLLFFLFQQQQHPEEKKTHTHTNTQYKNSTNDNEETHQRTKNHVEYNSVQLPQHA